ncbi:MAG: hypothetical protein JWM74_2471 [Myxococcaceae bacterium]|nr:hypothetical protein [Myxococcaceae bacterium]
MLARVRGKADAFGPMRFAPAIFLLALGGCDACGPKGSAATDAGPTKLASLDAGSVGATQVVATDAAAIDVVSHASTQWDAGAPVVASGVVDGAALRARHKARLGIAAPVTVLRGATPAEIGEKLCAAVVPKRPPETPVLLKPNIGGFDWFKDPEKFAGDDGLKGRITDPEFVRGVIRCLRARGHTKITVAEGWGATHKDWEKLVRVSGYEKMAAEEKVPLVAMDDDGVFDVAGDTPGKPLRVSGMEATHVPTLLMPKILAEHLEHGLFISLPKIKAHRFGVVSMSVKGMQGTVMLSDAAPAFRQKWRMHKELGKYLDGQKKNEDDRAAYVASLEIFAERIADVLEVEAPDVVLAEGAPAMGGDGFQKLYPSAESYGVGGTNPIFVDRVGSALLGLWDVPELGKELGGHTSSPLIEVAAKRFGVDITHPVVTGDGAALLDAPRPIHFVGMAPFAIHRDAKAGSAPTAERPVAHAARGEATIDGKGNDAAWANATAVTWDTDTKGAPTGISTRARFLWSKKALTALFEIDGTDLNVDATLPTVTERARLYEEDCVELFLGLEPATPRHYYEIELGPLGHFFDIEVDRTPKSTRPRESTAWSASLTIAATHDAARKHATVEVAIAAPEVVHALTPGSRLALGLFRMEGKGSRHYLAWSPPRTEKPDFHVPDAFGSLIVDP